MTRRARSIHKNHWENNVRCNQKETTTTTAYKHDFPILFSCVALCVYIETIQKINSSENEMDEKQSKEKKRKEWKQ